MGQKLINLIIKIAGSIHLKYHRPKNLNSNLENIRIRARLLSSGCCQHKNGRKCSQNFYQKEEKNVLTEKKNHITILHSKISLARLFFRQTYTRACLSSFSVSGFREIVEELGVGSFSDPKT